ALEKIDKADFKTEFDKVQSNGTIQTNIDNFVGYLKAEAGLIKVGSDKVGKKSYDFARTYPQAYNNNTVYADNHFRIADDTAFDFFNFIKEVKAKEEFLDKLDAVKQKDVPQTENYQIFLKGEAWDPIKLKDDYGIEIDKDNTTLYKTGVSSVNFTVNGGVKEDNLKEEKRKLTETETAIQNLITNELTSRRTSLTTYKITDGFELVKKADGTGEKDNRRTSSELMTIKEKLEEIRYLENADTAISSFNDDENVAYSKLEELLKDFQQSKIFKFITVEGTTNADKWAIKIALGQKENPTDTLTTYQILPNGKLDDKFKEVMTKKDAELTDLAKLFKKKKAKEIITLIK
ncbi:19073_t:CDS:2, partial [Racocetra fulgida]